MGVIYPSRSSHARRSRQPKKRKLLGFFLIATITLVSINLAIAHLYRNRTYPQTTVAGTAMGNVAFADIEERAGKVHLSSKQMTIQYQDKKVTATIKDLGIKIDHTRTLASLEASRSWLPLANMFIKHRLAAPVTSNDLVLQQYGERIRPAFHQAPINARLTRANGPLEVKQGNDGHDLSISKLKAAVLTSLDAGTATITAPVTFKPPAYTTAQAERDAASFRKASQTPLSFTAGTSTFKATPADITSWYMPKGDSYALDETAIRTYILNASIKAGTRPQNLRDVAIKTKQAVEAQKPLTATLVPFPNIKTYRYCLGLRGVDASEQKVLSEVARQTFIDPRGWGLEGQVAFEEVGSDAGICDFTLWLAAADSMPSFGQICEPEWSCRVGTDVVINFTRWQETSPAWKQYGGSVADYRAMVINHETGHWFGFDHSSCPGSGQIAPVMMQQSIKLGGCTFNPWPTSKELGVYRNVLGL